jgi:hypothetical protein
MRGGMRHGVKEKTPISFILHEIKSNTKLLLIKPKHFATAITRKARVQFLKTVYGMRYDEKNPTVFGAV